MHDVFFFTDIHGMGDLYDAIMNYCLKEDPECTIIFGGDACDRGPNGYRIMKELLNNPQVVYLMGNHEQLFIDAAKALKANYHGELEEESIFYYLYHQEMDYSNGIDAIRISLYNGGYQTLHDWMLDGMPMDIIERLEELPYCCSYENIDFCHAGGQYKVFARIEAAGDSNLLIRQDDINHILWDRNCLGLGWTPNHICVHGHTPVTYLPKKYTNGMGLLNARPCAYVGHLDERMTGKKIDMDTCACASGRAYVLNCLTFQAVGFKDTDVNNEEIRHHYVEQIEVIQF